MSNVFNVQGSIGAIHTGAGDQVVHTGAIGASINAGQAVAALDEVLAALRERGAPPDALELVEDLRSEARKERPNRLKIGGLIEGVKSTVEALAVAPQAWATVAAWFAALSQLAK